MEGAAKFPAHKLTAFKWQSFDDRPVRLTAFLLKSAHDDTPDVLDFDRCLLVTNCFVNGLYLFKTKVIRIKNKVLEQSELPGPF